jgi:hypothetical protein
MAQGKVNVGKDIVGGMKFQIAEKDFGPDSRYATTRMM